MFEPVRPKQQKIYYTKFRIYIRFCMKSMKIKLLCFALQAGNPMFNTSIIRGNLCGLVDYVIKVGVDSIQQLLIP